MDKVIAISRQHGSGGRQIGKLVSEQLHIPFYDKEIVREAVCQSGLCAEQFDGADLRGAGNGLYSIVPGVPFELPVKDTLYLAQREAICNLAAGGPCVIVGRGACEVLKGRLPLLRVFIYADMETKIRRVVEEYQELPENAEKRLYAVDKKRMAYYSFYEKKEKGFKYNRADNNDGGIRVVVFGVQRKSKRQRVCVRHRFRNFLKRQKGKKHDKIH